MLESRRKGTALTRCRGRSRVPVHGSGRLAGDPTAVASRCRGGRAGARCCRPCRESSRSTHGRSPRTARRRAPDRRALGFLGRAARGAGCGRGKTAARRPCSCGAPAPSHSRSHPGRPSEADSRRLPDRARGKRSRFSRALRYRGTASSRSESHSSLSVSSSRTCHSCSSSAIAIRSSLPRKIGYARVVRRRRAAATYTGSSLSARPRACITPGHKARALRQEQ